MNTNMLRLVPICSFFLIAGCAVSTPSPQAIKEMTPQELNQLAVDLWENSKSEYSDPELALKYAELSSAKNPKYGRAYYTKGFAYFKLGKYQQSIENFTKSIEIDPSVAESYNGRGWVYGTINEYSNAIKDFSKAIEIDPTLKVAYNNRALAYLEIHENQKACADFQKVCELGDCGNKKHAEEIGKCK